MRFDISRRRENIIWHRSGIRHLRSRDERGLPKLGPRRFVLICQLIITASTESEKVDAGGKMDTIPTMPVVAALALHPSRLMRATGRLLTMGLVVNIAPTATPTADKVAAFAYDLT